MELYYHLLDPPTLTINNVKGTFGCGNFASLNHLSCSHASECRIKEKYFTFPQRTSLEERVNRFPKGWTQLRWSGLVQCRDFRTLKEVAFEYFTALNSKRCKKYKVKNFTLFNDIIQFYKLL